MLILSYEYADYHVYNILYILYGILKTVFTSMRFQLLEKMFAREKFVQLDSEGVLRGRSNWEYFSI